VSPPDYVAPQDLLWDALADALGRVGVHFEGPEEVRAFLRAHAQAWELNGNDPPASLCEISAALARGLSNLAHRRPFRGP
jgi:hypothetical protein